jgi:hypothetical protein
MPTIRKKRNLYETSEGESIRLQLIAMASDDAFLTGPSYSADAVAYPDSQIPFVDKHMAYLNSHPQLDPDHYLSNLKLMMRRRS